MLSLEVDAHPDSSRYANTALSPKQVPTTVSAGLRVSPTAGPGVHRRPRATNGGKYRVSSKAGRASPGPANFESESAPRLWLRPELRGRRVSIVTPGVVDVVKPLPVPANRATQV